MHVRQLFDPSSSTYSYLVSSGTEAVLIDPVYEQHPRDAALIDELGLSLVATLDTHVHADHVTGAWLMHQRFGSRIGLAAVYGAQHVDLPLAAGDRIAVGTDALEVRATPGHTDGCLSFVGPGMVFTGDALLVRGAGRTDFQSGDARRLFRSIKEQLFSLPDDTIVYPGHDYSGRTSSTIGEERRHNPRIGRGAREEDFIGYMTNLGLPHPRQLAVAVPANLVAGKPAAPVAAAPSWGPVITTYAGHQEIAPEWVATHRQAVHLVDVRAAAELSGELGHLAGVQHIPLEELRARAGEIATEKPVVVICQTGTRSAMGTLILRAAGRTDCANLAGGMVRWRELGLPS
jgi:glyoxylase-like metal-dependent hydrolase (beta-lactamase superfamily II)/rhodanese-related sulfurtransferase